jgi:hypothetical protein
LDLFHEIKSALISNVLSIFLQAELFGVTRSLTPWAPNDVDQRRAVFLLRAKRRRSTSKHLNFPPYDVIGIKLKSMISATNTAVRWSNLICFERGEPQLSFYSMKKSFTLQPRDLCRLKKLGWGDKFALLYDKL